MTPTVLDVFTLTCLPLNGVSVHSRMTCGSGPNVSIINKGDGLSYGGFIMERKGLGNVTLTYQEECSFYLLWIWRFLAHSSSKKIMQNYLHLTITLTNGVCVALNPFILGELYHAIYHISTEPNPSHKGPCGWCRCGSILTFQTSLMNLTLPKNWGLMVRPGCMSSTMKKPLAFLLASHSLVIPQGGGFKGVHAFWG